MYVCISLFRVDQINSTTIMTNKNRLMPHTDQKWRHDLALYLSLLQSSGGGSRVRPRMQMTK